MDLLNLALLNPNDKAVAGLMALSCAFWAMIMIFVVAMLAFQIWLFWRIFARAGYNGAMAFLVLVPAFGALIVMCILAFGNWPVLKDRGQS